MRYTTTLLSIISLGLSSAFANGANREAISKGYGDFTWGQTAAEVAAGLDGDVHVTDDFIRVTAEPPIVETVYNFVFDQLVSVRLTFRLPDTDPNEPDEAGLAMINRMLHDKYGIGDVGARRALLDQGIRINSTIYARGRLTVTYNNMNAANEARKAMEAAAEARREAAEKAGDTEARRQAAGIIKNAL